MRDESMKTKPVIGQTLYKLNIGNRARRVKQELTPVVVTKVGRKYFSVCKEEHLDSPHMHTRFHLETWGQSTNYSADWALYTSEAEWEEERDAEKLWSGLLMSISSRIMVSQTTGQDIK